MNTEHIEKRLIRISLELSAIAESDCEMVSSLARAIQLNGKPVEELMVSELIYLFRKNNEEYNWMFTSLEEV